MAINIASEITCWGWGGQLHPFLLIFTRVSWFCIFLKMETVVLANSEHTIDAVEAQGISKEEPKLTLFQKYLTVWVLLAMALGIICGRYIPNLALTLEKATVANVSVPIAVLLWGIILPMMIQIDLTKIVSAIKEPKAILLTTIINYAIQPFSMYFLSLLFFRVVFGNYLSIEKQNSYIIGSVILAGAPCTAMVFVWSILMHGNATFTLAQVCVNDLILLVAYVPTVKLLAGASNIFMPWDTLIFSVLLFVVVPLIIGSLIRFIMQRNEKWSEWMNRKMIPVMDRLSMVFLLLMVTILFISQSRTITDNLVDILIIAVPMLIQSVFLWGLTFGLALWLKLPFDIAGPATLIATSNFFEMAVAIAISLYGSDSGAALATVVGVIIEVPVMLTFVHINNRLQNLFPKKQL
jgi:ACR3 family arsenite transporter